MSYINNYISFFFLFIIMLSQPHTYTLFPYTTLFRSCGRPRPDREGTRPRDLIRGQRTSPSASSSRMTWGGATVTQRRSEEHTSELQSPCNLVCCLLLEKNI